MILSAQNNFIYYIYINRNGYWIKTQGSPKNVNANVCQKNMFLNVYGYACLAIAIIMINLLG